METDSEAEPFTDYACDKSFQLVSFTTKQKYTARYSHKEGVTPFCREWVEVLNDEERVKKEFGNDMYKIVLEVIQQVHGENRLFNQFQLPFKLESISTKEENK